MLYTSACQLLLLAAVVVAVPTTTLSTNSQQRKDQSAPAQSDIPVPDIGDRLVPLGLGALGILGVWSLGSRAKRQSRKADNSWRPDRRFPDFDPPPHQSVIGKSRYTDWDLADYPPYKPEEDEALQRDIALCVRFLVQQERPPEDADLRKVYAEYYRRCQGKKAAAFEWQRDQAKSSEQRSQAENAVNEAGTTDEPGFGTRVLKSMQQAFTGRTMPGPSLAGAGRVQALSIGRL